jgi:hypothetical protein
VPSAVSWASGNSASHISAIMIVPATAETRSAMPAITATPMPSRPSMNSQSAHAAPAIAWNADWNGPTSTEPRKPLVGEPPLIQARAAGVA